MKNEKRKTEERTKRKEKQESLLSKPHSVFRTRARYNQLVRKRENQSEKMLDKVPLHFRKPPIVLASSCFIFTHYLRIIPTTYNFTFY